MRISMYIRAMPALDAPRLNEIILIARPFWAVRALGLIPLVLGMLIDYQAVCGALQSTDDFGYRVSAGLHARIVIGCVGAAVSLLGVLLVFTRARISLNGSTHQVSVQYSILLVNWSDAAQPFANFDRVSVSDHTLVTPFFSAVSFRVSLEGKDRKSIWLGDFMGVEFPRSRPFYISMEQAYQQAHAQAEAAAAATSLPIGN